MNLDHSVLECSMVSVQKHREQLRLGEAHQPVESLTNGLTGTLGDDSCLSLPSLMALDQALGLFSLLQRGSVIVIRWVIQPSHEGI